MPELGWFEISVSVVAIRDPKTVSSKNSESLERNSKIDSNQDEKTRKL